MPPRSPGTLTPPPEAGAVVPPSQTGTLRPGPLATKSNYRWPIWVSLCIWLALWATPHAPGEVGGLPKAQEQAHVPIFL